MGHPFPHLLTGSTPGNLFRILCRYGGSIEASSWPRVLKIIASSLTLFPIQQLERWRYEEAINTQRFDPQPVYIIGHWRSGTTHLHNLMLEDTQFVSIDLVQCLIPSAFMTLGKLVRKKLLKTLPSFRPMDSVHLHPGLASSEDFPMATLSEVSHYHGYFFPDQAEEIFRRTVLFQDLSDCDIRYWQQKYLYLLKKISWYSGGRTLLLKNPANTGRLKHIVRLFPNARFIFVHRNPLEVYTSAVHQYLRFCQLFALTPYRKDQLEQFVIMRYRAMMESYLEDRKLIPSDRLIEVGHAEILGNSLATLEKIYSKLNLEGLATAAPRIEELIQNTGDYKKNSYSLDITKETAVRTAWDLGFRNFGYCSSERQH